MRSSRDPNEKSGIAGYGPEAFVVEETVIPYRVDFENLGPGSQPTPTEPATAPAQRVEIEDQLTENLDWNTLEWIGAGFGDYVIDAPANHQHYFTVVPVTYTAIRSIWKWN